MISPGDLRLPYAKPTHSRQAQLASGEITQHMILSEGTFPIRWQSVNQWPSKGATQTGPIAAKGEDGKQRRQTL